MKELAKQTSQATEDISQKIEAIQADTEGAVSAINQVTAVINQINEISTTIASAVEEQTVTTSKIGRNVGEASQRSLWIPRTRWRRWPPSFNRWWTNSRLSRGSEH